MGEVEQCGGKGREMESLEWRDGERSGGNGGFKGSKVERWKKDELRGGKREVRWRGGGNEETKGR